jgi:hypothetical protein
MMSGASMPENRSLLILSRTQNVVLRHRLLLIGGQEHGRTSAARLEQIPVRLQHNLRV